VSSWWRVISDKLVPSSLQGALCWFEDCQQGKRMIKEDIVVDEKSLG
jgi:hypothetical protein